jgi:hypothetical protein
VPARGTRPAGAEEDDVVERCAGQAALDRPREAGDVGVVADRAAAGEDDGVDRAEGRGLR